MKKETRNLFIGILVGVVTGVISDTLFELRHEIASFLETNPVLSMIVFIIICLLVYLTLGLGR